MKTIFSGSRKVFIPFVILVIGLGFFFRFYQLDMDPLPINLGGINILDEPYYCIAGLNSYLQDNGRLLEEIQVKETYILAFHNSRMTQLSLNFFGNSYYGFRVGLVVFSVLAILALAFIAVRTEGLSRLQKLLLCLFLMTDFYFFIFSRYQNPQLYSITWLSLVLLVALWSESRKYVLTFVATLAIILILYVYPYNLFIGLGIFLWCVFEWVVYKNKSPFLRCTVGAVAGVVVVEVLFRLNGYSLTSYFSILSQFNEVRDESLSGDGGFNIVTNILQVPYTNLIRYNPIYICVIFLGTYLCFRNYPSLKNYEKIAVFAVFAAFVQSLFMLSYPYKKWIVLLPFLFVLLTTILRLSNRNLSTLDRVAISGLLIISVFLGYKSIVVNNDLGYWYTFADRFHLFPLPTWIQGWLMVTLFAGSILLALPFLFKVKFDAHSVTVALSICLGIGLMHWYLITPTYNFRDNLQNFAHEINGNYLSGDYNHSYSFYNTAIIGHNPYDKALGRIETAKVDSIYENLPVEQVYFIRRDFTASNPPPRIMENGMYFHYTKGGDILTLYKAE